MVKQKLNKLEVLERAITSLGTNDIPEQCGLIAYFFDKEHLKRISRANINPIQIAGYIARMKTEIEELMENEYVKNVVIIGELYKSTEKLKRKENGKI